MRYAIADAAALCERVVYGAVTVDRNYLSLCDAVEFQLTAAGAGVGYGVCTGGGCRAIGVCGPCGATGTAFGAWA